MQMHTCLACVLEHRTCACSPPCTSICLSSFDWRQGSAHAMHLPCRGAAGDNSAHREVVLAVMADQVRVACNPEQGKREWPPSHPWRCCTGQACRRADPGRGTHLEAAPALEQVRLQALQEGRRGAAAAARRARCARPAAPAAQQSPLRKLLPASQQAPLSHCCRVCRLQVCCHLCLFPRASERTCNCTARSL